MPEPVVGFDDPGHSRRVLVEAYRRRWVETRGRAGDDGDRTRLRLVGNGFAGMTYDEIVEAVVVEVPERNVESELVTCLVGAGQAAGSLDEQLVVVGRRAAGV